MKDTLSESLKQVREQKNLSQVQAAKKIGVSNSTYRGWEEGRKVPAEQMAQIALAFETSVSALLGLRRESNEELAKAIACFNQGFEHVKKALSAM